MPDETEEKKKWCPDLDKYCIGERCGKFVGIQQERMGVRTQGGVCGIVAVAIIMSSPRPPPPRTVNLPSDLKI